MRTILMAVTALGASLALAGAATSQTTSKPADPASAAMKHGADAAKDKAATTASSMSSDASAKAAAATDTKAKKKKHPPADAGTTTTTSTPEPH
ncbi:MAG: hypothetical protein ACREE0_22075 [Phenylobacterium sp.]